MAFDLQPSCEHTPRAPCFTQTGLDPSAAVGQFRTEQRRLGVTVFAAESSFVIDDPAPAAALALTPAAPSAAAATSAVPAARGVKGSTPELLLPRSPFFAPPARFLAGGVSTGSKGKANFAGVTIVLRSALALALVADFLLLFPLTLF